MFLFIPDAPAHSESAHLEWSTLSAPEARVLGTLAEFARTAQENTPTTPPILVLPVSRLSFIDALLPPVSAAKREALVHFAIEDKLTVDPASIHAVVLQPAVTGKNRYVIAALDRAWLTDVLAMLAARNIHPKMAVAESALALPPSDTWRVVLGGVAGNARAFVVRPDGLTHPLDADADAHEPPFALQLALNEATAAEAAALPTSIVVRAPNDSDVDVTAWQARLGGNIRLSRETTSAGAHGDAAPSLSALAAANLLTADFAPRREDAAWWRAMKPAVVLLLIAAGLQLTMLAADAWRLQRERAAIENAMRDLFKQQFPDATAIVDPALQLSRNLTALARERGLAIDPALKALEQMAAFLDNTPGARDALTGLALTNGTLTVELGKLSTETAARIQASAPRAGITATGDAAQLKLSLRVEHGA